MHTYIYIYIYISKDKQGESTSNYANRQKQQIDVTINLLAGIKKCQQIFEESCTLQIASISSKIMTCRSLWSPEKEKNMMALVITKRPT